MRLGIDFDGTIADVTEAKIRYARERLGEDLTPLETNRAQGLPRLGERRYVQMVEATHATDWTLTMRPMLGAIEVLQALAEHHELFVITARNDDEIGWARAWLEPHGLPFRDVIHTSRGSKAAACETLAVDLMFDDSPLVLRELEPCALHLALIDADYNRHLDLPDRAHRVDGWPAFHSLVSTVPPHGVIEAR
jgi:uncharacterized HAD superfamily protein